MRGTFDNEIRAAVLEGANPTDPKRKMPLKKSKPIRKTSQGGPPGKGMDTDFQPYNAGTKTPSFPKSKSMQAGQAKSPAGFHRQAVLKGK